MRMLQGNVDCSTTVYYSMTGFKYFYAGKKHAWAHIISRKQSITRMQQQTKQKKNNKRSKTATKEKTNESNNNISSKNKDNHNNNNSSSNNDKFEQKDLQI